MFIWSLIKQYLYPILGVLVVLVLGYTHYKAEEFGYSRAETKYVKVIAEINSKSADLLKAQKEEHDKWVEKQDALVNNLEEQNKKLNDIVKENKREASQDTNAKRPAVGKPSVLRLNRIR